MVLSETWTDIPGYEGRYKVTSTGKLGSFIREPRFMKPNIGTSGYYKTTLRKGGKETYKYIHYLIALTFIPNPDNLPCVDHINRDKLDNRVENLRWVSYSQNSRNHGLYSTNTSGYNGIHFRQNRMRKPWRVLLYRGSAKHFATKEEAIEYRLSLINKDGKEEAKPDGQQPDELV